MPGTLIVKGEQRLEQGFFATGRFLPAVVTSQQAQNASDRRRSVTAVTTALVAVVLVTFAAPANVYGQGEKTVTKGETGKPVPVKSGQIEANGVNYFYEIHGRGEPLLLLHGGLGSIDMFGPILPILASERQVIAVDLHGHGRTALGDRPINLVDMGHDMAVLTKELGHQTVDVLGYSLGGGVGLRFA